MSKERLRQTINIQQQPIMLTTKSQLLRPLCIITTLTRDHQNRGIEVKNLAESDAEYYQFNQNKTLSSSRTSCRKLNMLQREWSKFYT